MNLSTNYLRVLSSLTEIIEREVTEILRILENPVEEGEIIRTTVSFSPEERMQKIHRLRTLLEENRKFFRALHAKPVVYPEKQIFDAKVTQLWTILRDSLPEKMKGYGTLEKTEREWISEHINRLLEIIGQLKM